MDETPYTDEFIAAGKPNVERMTNAIWPERARYPSSDHSPRSQAPRRVAPSSQAVTARIVETFKPSDTGAQIVVWNGAGYTPMRLVRREITVGGHTETEHFIDA